MKKIISLAMSVLMMLTMLAGLSFTAEASTSKVTVVNFHTQYYGIRSGMTVEDALDAVLTPSNAVYRCEGRPVFYQGSKVLSESAKFAEGKTYKIVATLVAEGSFQFDAISNIKATIDNEKATVSAVSGKSESKYIQISYTYPTCSTLLSDIDLIQVSYPLEGDELTANAYDIEGRGNTGVASGDVETTWKRDGSIVTGQPAVEGTYYGNITVYLSSGMTTNSQTLLHVEGMDEPLYPVTYGDTMCIYEVTFTVCKIHKFGTKMYSTYYCHYQMCEKCGAIENSAEHEYDNDTDYTCNVCGFDRAYGAAPHVHNWEYTEELNNTDCSLNSEELYTCTECGETKIVIGPPAGHQWDGGEVSQTASFKENGSIHNNCYMCGTAKDTPIYKVSNVKLSQTSYVYDGKAKKPKVTVKDSKGNKLVKGEDYKLTYKNNKKVGTATVTVTLIGERYSGKKKLTYKIVPKSTKLTKLTKKSKSFKATWKKQTTQTTGYQIKYSTSSKFTKKTSKTVTVNKNTSTSKTIKKLKGGKKYYVKIRTYKTVDGKKYYSSWSKVMTVKTKK